MSEMARGLTSSKYERAVMRATSIGLDGWVDSRGSSEPVRLVRLEHGTRLHLQVIIECGMITS